MSREGKQRTLARINATRAEPQVRSLAASMGPKSVPPSTHPENVTVAKVGVTEGVPCRWLSNPPSQTVSRDSTLSVSRLRVGVKTVDVQPGRGE